MREILFRGKRVDNGEWVEGWYLQNKIATYIIPIHNFHNCTQYHYLEIDDYFEVIPETVGQYTGLTDKNGTKIFEGDILHQNYNKYDDMQVVYHNGGFSFEYTKPHFNDCTLVFGKHNIDYCKLKVIGNIHDNPELLNAKE